MADFRQRSERGNETRDMRNLHTRKKVTKPHSRINEDNRVEKMYEYNDEKWFGPWDKYLGLENAMNRFARLYDGMYYNQMPRQVPKGGKGSGSRAKSVDEVNRRGGTTKLR